MNISFVTYQQLVKDSVALAEKIHGRFDAVVAVPRSGCLPATIVATELNLPLGVVGSRDVFAGERLGSDPFEHRSVLLVDDSVSSGRAMQNAVHEYQA